MTHADRAGGCPGAKLPVGLGQQDRVVLFDGVCNLCSGWVRFLVKRDPGVRLKLCSLQSQEGQAILKHLGRPLDDLDTMVFLECGRAWYRSTAFLRIIRLLPFPWPLLFAGIIIPPFVRNLLYNLIARNRYRLFGRTEACMLPGPALEAHFLASPPSGRGREPS